MSANARRSRTRAHHADTSWDRVATWYDGWVGDGGSRYHRALAVPATLRLLQPGSADDVLDVGCGQGVLAPYIAAAGARYTGVDASPRLIAIARRRHGSQGQFVVGDARALDSIGALRRHAYDTAVFLLSIQDMDPLEPVFASVSRVLRPQGRVVLLMTHPAFRQPRHSGWGVDGARGLTYRRVDSYLTPMAVPMKAIGGGPPTRSFHRPISAYVNALAGFGFAVDAMDEVADDLDLRRSLARRAMRRAEREIPLFLTVRARRL